MNVLQTSERRNGTDIRKKASEDAAPGVLGTAMLHLFYFKHWGVRGSKCELTGLFSGALITQSTSRSFLKPQLTETTASSPCPCPSSQTHTDREQLTGN